VVSTAQTRHPAHDNSRTLTDAVDVLVVVAGRAGLGLSALLAEAGREHLVLEGRDRVGCASRCQCTPTAAGKVLLAYR
jgi:flavin-dependent dehydrogenase